ncbi:lactonase family protein [Rubripirellula amarantea]|nr:lactonase family protein [Rubripirellula amarantea]MDA8745770.1 lactonase family protein [Rubripirellula amarantea]
MQITHLRPVFLPVLLTLFLMGSVSMADNDSLDVWIGTSASPQSEGIYHATFDPAQGKLSPSKLVAKMIGPGFLAQHPTLDVLYAVGRPVDGEPSVVAFAIENNQLRQINAVAVGDGDACHVSVDPTGKTLLTAQYGGGSVAAFGLNSDGSLAERTELIDHEGGSGVVAGRQNSSHAHYAGISPNNQFALVPDLGLDKVMIYRLDPETAKLTQHGFGKVPAGGGPRHMKFHSNGKWIYVLNELSLSVTLFDWDADAGKMTPRQTIPAVPKQALAKEKFKSASEIIVHPNGKFLYSANRGHDTITVYRIDGSNGELSVIEIENIRGATPRNFNITPDGKWLLAAGQDSNTVATFAINDSTGELTYNQNVINSPSPICLLFGR